MTRRGGRGRAARRVLPGVLACAAVSCAVWTVAAPVRSQPSPAGDTGAVLSFVDAAAGRIEVVRHWPQAATEVDVYPFVPYFWSGCPGPGAIMILVTAPVPPPSAASLFSGWDGPNGGPNLERIRALETALGEDPAGADELRRLASGLRTPGDPIVEAAKLFAPIADLATYERQGYAVFAFVTWQGWRCGVTFRAVPEGYGIPFVR